MEILDASALLAFLKKETGYEQIKVLFEDAHKKHYSVFIHQINYIEVVKKLLQFIGEHETKKILTDLEQPFLGVSNYLDERLSGYASWMATQTNISLGDAIGLAFTKIMNGKFWTADQALQDIAQDQKINIKLIRP